MKRYHRLLWLAAATPLLWSGSATGLEVNLTQFRPYVDVNAGGERVRIQRVQDTANTLTGFFAKTSRPCPPFCIHPMHVAPGVTTVGEAEIFDFMVEKLAKGTGVLIDARTPDWYQKGTIPGSINVPYTLLAEANEANPDFTGFLSTSGVRPRSAKPGGFMTKVAAVFGDEAQASGKWDFSGAKDLLLFCNGIWCDQSPRAIQGLLNIGYPAEKLHYYRGGMNIWALLGLTIVPGK